MRAFLFSSRMFSKRYFNLISDRVASDSSQAEKRGKDTAQVLVVARTTDPEEGGFCIRCKGDRNESSLRRVWHLNIRKKGWPLTTERLRTHVRPIKGRKICKRADRGGVLLLARCADVVRIVHMSRWPKNVSALIQYKQPRWANSEIFVLFRQRN